MRTPLKELCKWQQPEEVANRLINTFGDRGLIWLDGDGSHLGRWVTLATDPIEQIYCKGLPYEGNSSNPFKALRELKEGHWTGWISYEAGAWTEPSNPWKPDSMATLWIASHDPILRFDLKNLNLWIEGYDSKRLRRFAIWLDKISKETKKEPFQEQGIPINSWQWHKSKSQFIKDVATIKNWISTGDIFQANLTTCCTTKMPQGTTAINLFQKLRLHCPAPFSGIAIGSGHAADEAVISASPERFIKVLPNGEIETRPIKGTRPRNFNPLYDAELAADLISSEKDRAENIMIVDLLRNDLGKVCQPGSIVTPQLLDLESYSEVHHLTSVIKGALSSNTTWIDALEACWPGGSITGAPKLRACQRLHELEPIARGPYCGSLIRLDWDGTFDSNILIRSLMLKGKTLRANAGCGIVADSEASNEAEELAWKLFPILRALE